jgi:hypothetical protein
VAIPATRRVSSRGVKKSACNSVFTPQRPSMRWMATNP